MVRTIWGLFCLPVLFISSLYAQKSVRAVRIDTPPRIDGMLDEAVWKQGEMITAFVQREPNPGEAPSERTEVYILYGEKHIYIGFRCYDDPSKITAKELKRDISLGEDDRVQIIFDTFRDRRNGFWFQIGPRGCIGDALVSENGAAFNKEWDGLWEGRARIHDRGWDAEIAIPFLTLNFRPGQNTWGMKIIRHIRRKLERVDWPEANLNTYNFQVSDAGLLTGLEGLSQGVGLDIRPYALTGFNQQTGEKTEGVFDAGGDIFYRVSSGLNAALTFNTDFAQTEVDSRQINLTRFSLFFPEKRQFFLDGANYFNFGFNGDREHPFGTRIIPYFSRRIGLDRQRNPIPIIAGGKIAGQAGAWNIGALNIIDQSGTDNRNFTVARVTRNVGRQSFIGVIGTSGDAIGAPGNWQGGADFRVATSRFRGNKNLALTGFALKSHTEELSGKDLAYGGDINYPNDLLSFRLGRQSIGENYRAGIGFVPRTGIRETYVSFFPAIRPRFLGLLKVTSGGRLDYITDFAAKLLTRESFLQVAELEFRSGEIVEYAWMNTYDFLDADFEIHPQKGITIPAGAYEFWQQGLEVTTAQWRNFWVAMEVNWGDFFNGRRTTTTLSGGLKIGVPVFLGSEYEHNRVHLAEGDFTTEVYRISLDVNFSPDISLSNYIQYDNLSENMGLQSRFRWIIKPGKEFLLVWNSLQPEPFARLHPADRLVENTLRFKVNYNFRF